MKRHRGTSEYSWTEVVDVPFEGPVPALPERPRELDVRPLPDPPRPLGRHGRAVWDTAWRSAGAEPLDEEALLVLCEQMDERVSLRLRVLRGNEWRLRSALRMLDAQVAAGLSALGQATGRAVPQEWPAETRRWWTTVCRQPHCVLWSASDWEFALGTALVAATFHSGDVRAAAELRQRERILGTTTDARRDLRIRYVEPEVEENESEASVTAMDAYRRMAAKNTI
jgi:hypothetical protein